MLNQKFPSYFAISNEHFFKIRKKKLKYSTTIMPVIVLIIKYLRKFERICLSNVSKRGARLFLIRFNLPSKINL